MKPHIAYSYEEMMAVHMGAVMNNFPRNAANVAMALSLIPAAFWLYVLVSHLLGHPNRHPFSVEALLLGVLPWAVCCLVGYLVDARLPWQVLKKE